MDSNVTSIQILCNFFVQLTSFKLLLSLQTQHHQFFNVWVKLITAKLIKSMSQVTKLSKIYLSTKT